MEKWRNSHFFTQNNVYLIYISMSTAQIYTNLLNIAGYLALFIICFIKLFALEYESMSLLLLFVFHIFMTIFIVIFKSTLSDIASHSIWNIMFIGNILSFISLLLVIITYNHLHRQYNLNGHENVPLSHFYAKKMKIFKALYITSISIIISILILLLFSNINIIKYVSVGLSISLLGIAGYNVYNGNIILKLLDKTSIK